MALHIGSASVSGVYVGGTLASAVYLGSTQVWASFTPTTTVYSSPGTYTYTIPPGTTTLEYVGFGAGVAGTNGTIGNGQGGRPGFGNSGTTRIGIDMPSSTTTLTVVVGAGGIPSGGKGGDSTITGTGFKWMIWLNNQWMDNGTTFKADAGTGGMGITTVAGGTPSPVVYKGITHSGGAGGTTLGSAGNGPGGGGAGGGIGGQGGRGGPGGIWIYSS